MPRPYGQGIDGKVGAGDTPIAGIYTATVSATSLNSAIWSKFM
jgi:hypothetical protein